MQKFINFLIIAITALVFIISPLATEAAVKKPAPKVRYSAGLDICLLSFMKQYSIAKGYKEFNTSADCEAFRASLKAPIPVPETFSYFDGVCYSSNDKKFADLKIYINFLTKDACEKAKSDQVNQVNNAISSNESCFSNLFLNYTQKTFNCTFDVIDSTPFKLNPSLKIKAKLAVAPKTDGSECSLQLKNPSEAKDFRSVLVCKNIQIGTYEDNVNLNPKYSLKPPLSSQYFRVSNLDLFIGDSKEGKTKSTIYIAHNPLIILSGDSASSYVESSYLLSNNID